MLFNDFSSPIQQMIDFSAQSIMKTSVLSQQAQHNPEPIIEKQFQLWQSHHKETHPAS